MKKTVFFAALTAILTLCSFISADDRTSCEVKYAEGYIASLVNFREKGGTTGNTACITAKVRLNKKATEDVVVAVKVKDGNTELGTVHVTIYKDNNFGSEYYYNGIEQGHYYTLSIVDAYCK